MRKGYHWVLIPDDRFHGGTSEEFALAKKLVSIGGKYVAYPPTPPSERTVLTEFINRVLQYGKVYEPSQGRIFEGRVGRVTMPRLRQCHNNTGRLFEAQKIMAMGSGWALKPGEDAWHRHSWGIAEDGTVLETTPPLRLCFGCSFDDADGFFEVTSLAA